MKIFHDATKPSYWKVLKIDESDSSYAILSLGWEHSARSQGILVNSKADDESLMAVSTAAQLGVPITNAVLWVRCKDKLDLNSTYFGHVPNQEPGQMRMSLPYFEIIKE